MQDQIKRLNQLAEQICQGTKDKERLSRSALKQYEDIIAEMQEQIDTMVNDIIREDQ